MVRSGSGFPDSLGRLPHDKFVLLVEGSLEALAADLDDGALEALVFWLVLGKGDEAEAAAAGELL